MNFLDFNIKPMIFLIFAYNPWFSAGLLQNTYCFFGFRHKTNEFYENYLFWSNRITNRFACFMFIRFCWIFWGSLLNYRHPDPWRVWKEVSEQRFLTPLRVASAATAATVASVASSKFRILGDFYSTSELATSRLTSKSIKRLRRSLEKSKKHHAIASLFLKVTNTG